MGFEREGLAVWVIALYRLCSKEKKERIVFCSTQPEVAVVVFGSPGRHANADFARLQARLVISYMIRRVSPTGRRRALLGCSLRTGISFNFRKLQSHSHLDHRQICDLDQPSKRSIA
jgi:hypothetical protein